MSSGCRSARAKVIMPPWEKPLTRSPPSVGRRCIISARTLATSSARSRMWWPRIFSGLSRSVMLRGNQVNPSPSGSGAHGRSMRTGRVCEWSPVGTVGLSARPWNCTRVGSSSSNVARPRITSVTLMPNTSCSRTWTFTEPSGTDPATPTNVLIASLPGVLGDTEVRRIHAKHAPAKREAP